MSKLFEPLLAKNLRKHAKTNKQCQERPVMHYSAVQGSVMTELFLSTCSRPGNQAGAFWEEIDISYLRGWGDI